MLKQISLITVILSTVVLGKAKADPWTATVYDMNSNRTKALYTSALTEEKDGNQVKGHVVYKDLQGKEAIVEDFTTVDGKLMKYVLHQKQVNEEGKLEVRDGRIFFTYTKEGKDETDDEKAADNLIVPPIIVPYIQSHWDQILNGDTLSIRFAAMDRKETVGFKFFKIEEKEDGPDKVRIKMKPTSFVIAAIVDPLILIFDKNSKKLIELKGRTIPRQLIDGKYRDLDADTIFSG